jgi:hypothetical protein
MPNKKNKLVLTFLAILASGMALAGCDDIEAALPTSQEETKLVDNANGDGSLSIPNNTMKQIYDALVTEGDTNSEKALSNVLYIYSQSVYGDFFTIKAAIDADSTTDLQAIADKYDIYKVDGKGDITTLKNIYRDLLYRVKKVFLSYITNSTYQERSKFCEKKFHDAQVKAYYDVGDNFKTNYVQVDGALRLADPNDTTSTANLKVDELSDYFADIFTTYKNYITLAVLPDIYRDELVCQYLYTQNYLTLGKNYSRKVDIIKVTSNTAYPAATQNLFKAYGKDVIAAKKDATKYDFTFLDSLSKGTISYSSLATADKAVVDSIYTDAGWTKFTASEVAALSSDEQTEFQTVCKESTYGGYITNYIKLFDNANTGTGDILKDFTNSGAYTASTGLAIKKQALIATDDTKHGWFSKTDLTDSLPSDASTRLFKMGVASEVDKLADDAKGTYVWNINNTDYLVSANYETTNDYPYLISDSGTWYIVKVQQAIKSAKLSSTDSDYYGDEKAQIFARSIAATLSSSDTYKKDSNKYFVDQMAIAYHDTYVYNYFKTTFPDLFD